jgi:serine O-acetyltransferase
MSERNLVEPDISFRRRIAEDLTANTGQTGFMAALKSCVSDPSFSTVFLHRCAMALRGSGLVFLSKLIWRWNAAISGCLIHPSAVIGTAFRLPHPTGVVVGEGARIGRGVTLYQNVTVGRGLNDARYPVLEDEVTVFPNSVIAGGLSIGRGAVIGACSVVIANVPSGAVVSGNPARILRMRAGSVQLDIAANADRCEILQGGSGAPLP